MAVADTDVDVTDAASNLQGTIDALETEVVRDTHELGVKRARLDALKRAQRSMEKAADPDIQPRRPSGRRKQS